MYAAAVHCTMRYDTRCCFNVRSKADASQLSLPHGTDELKKSGKEKRYKTDTQKYRRGTARRAVSVETVRNIALMFHECYF